MGALRGEEEWARQMVAAALGASVVQFDDGSEPGMFDLAVEHDDGGRAAVEVTAAADPECIVLWKLMNGNDDRWVEDDLIGGWMVSLHPRARAKRLRDELPGLLRDLEAAGVTNFRRPRRDRGEMEARAASLGIASAHRGGTDFPGSIYITIDDAFDRRAGWSDASPPVTVEWIGEFLRSDPLADVRRKLARSGCEERHAFVIVPGFTTAPFGVANLLMGYGGEPEGRPDLPEEITHVWLASTWRVGTGWRWDPKVGWQSFDKLQEE